MSIKIANNNKINKYKIESYISYNAKILKHVYNFYLYKIETIIYPRFDYIKTTSQY